MKQNLTGVSETLLIPLWARSVETEQKDPILKDSVARDIVNSLDYDFSRLDNAWKSQVGCVVRAWILDRETKKFIDQHPNGVVINLGAGLDSRFYRTDNGSILWYDLDLPQVQDLRARFMDQTERNRFISKSILDPAWAREVDAEERPVLVIAEGLFPYFEENEVKSVLDTIATAFPGARMLCEMMTPQIVAMGSKHDAVSDFDAVFKWGIKSGREFEKLDTRIRFRAEWNYYDFFRPRWRWMGILALIPWFKNRFNNRIVHLEVADRG